MSKLFKIIFLSLFTSLSGLFATFDIPKSALMPPEVMPNTTPDIFISLDYTLWTARQAGLETAVANYYLFDQDESFTGSMVFPEWKLRSGFKIGFGTFIPYDNWDIQADFTWFYNKPTYLKTAHFTPDYAGSTWFISPNDGIDILNQELCKWSNYFNRIDIDLGRSFYAGEYLALRPFIGLVGAWEKQTFHIDYKSTANLRRFYSWRNHQFFWGFGPYTGLDMTFHCPVVFGNNYWSFFLNSGFGLPWSHFKATHERFNDETHTSNEFYRNKVTNATPLIDMMLGVRFETWWSDNTWMFLIEAGWEEQVWFFHNNYFVMGGSGAVGNGNYSMQGLTVKFAFAF